MNYSVSVIMPVFNSEDFIEKSLVSLMEQTFESVQFIIIDDGSTDGSLNIINKVIAHYPKRKDNTVIISRENRGVSRTRNEGIQLSSGQFLIHFDSDDWAEPHMLEEMYKRAIDNCADMVVCDYKIVDDRGYHYISQIQSEKCVDLIVGLLNGTIHGYLWNKLISRELCVSNNRRINEDINYFEDFIYCLSCFLDAKKIHFLNKSFYYYNKCNNDSITKKITDSKIRDVNLGVFIIEKYLQDNKPGVSFENDIHKFKLNQKVWFIICSRKAITSDILKLYSESNKFIKQLDERFYIKLLLHMSSIGLYQLVAFILRLDWFIRKLLGKLHA